MADTNTGGSISARAKREGGYRLSGGGASTAGGIKATSSKNVRRSSKSSSNYTLSGGKVIDKTTGRSVELSKFGGNLSKAITELKDPTLKQGVIGGKVYSNVRTSEVLRNQLQVNTKARELKDISKRRDLAIESQKRLKQGRGTSADIFNVLSVGTGRVENIVRSGGVAVALRNKNEAQKFRTAVINQLNPDQKRFYQNLPSSQKDSYLVSVANRRVSPIQEIKRTPTTYRSSKLSGMSNNIRRTLENWASKINQRTKTVQQVQAEREAKQLASNIARKELIEYLPTGTKTLGKGINALINLGAKTFTGSLSFGEQLASAGEKAVFLLPALGASISTGTISKFGKEFVTPEQIGVLKEIYTDPKTYRDALIGAGVITILGGVRSGKFTAKQVKKIPRTTKKYSARTILRDPQGNIAYVTKSGVVRPVPRGFKTITRALTRDVKDFAIRRVTKFPKTTTAQPGTVFRNAKGELRVANKQGKVVKLPKESMRRDLVSAFKKGASKRAKRTAKAREAKARAKRGLTKKELKAQQKKILDKQINKEVSQILKRYKIKPNDRVAFKKAYKKFRTKQTKASAKQLQKLSEKFETEKGVRAIDRIIKNRLKRSSKKTVSKKKTIKRPKPTERELASAEQFQARIKADTLARKKGFKDRIEQRRYENAFKKYKQGQKGAERTLKSIEKKMANRKAKASKIASKRFEEFRNRLVKNAIRDLKAGKITIKQKQYKVIRTRPKLPAKQVERIALAVDARLNKIEDIRYKRQAKSALKDIVEGKQIRVSNPKLNSAIRRLLNKEQIKLLRNKKLLDIAQGKIKGKSPKSRISKASKKQILAKAKESTRKARLQRKKLKRSPAGDKQARKIRRKQIRREIEKIERIVKGDAKVPDEYTLEVTKSGYKLVPKTSKIPKNLRIRTAKDVLKKSKLSKKDNVVVGKDGTIQVLKTKTKTKTSLQQRETALKQAYNSLKRLSKQRLKLKPKINPKIRKVLRKTSVVKGKTPTSAIRSASAIASTLSRRLKSTVKSGIKTKNKTISALKQEIKPILKQISLVSKDLDNLQDADLTQSQDKAIKQIQNTLQDSITDSKQLLEQVTKLKPPKRKPSKPPIKKIPLLPKIPSLTFNTKLPKGYSLIVNAKYKKGNKVLTRKLRTTPNRAKKIMNAFVDRNIMRSYDLTIVGLKKQKDIKPPASNKKFRKKKGKNPKVQGIVEKTKYAIDKRGEKKQLKISRRKASGKSKSSRIRKKSSKKRASRKKKK